MKYIKKYEEKKTRPYDTSVLDIGDYVLLDKMHDHQKVKLIDVGDDSGPGGKLYYWISFSDTGKIIWITDWMIDRKLTDDEIEQFKLDSKINQYNI